MILASSAHYLPRASQHLHIRLVSLSTSMPSDVVILSWLSDLDATTPTGEPSSPGRTSRKRACPAAAAEPTSRKRQRALAAANMNPPPSPPRSSSGLRSPAKPVERKSERLRGRNRQPVAEVEAQPPAFHHTNKPAALANPGQNAPILSPPVSSFHSRYVAALDLDAAGEASKSIATQSQTSSKRARTPSPRKSLRDLGMLNKPISYVSDLDRLPKETLRYWRALGSICRDLKTIPAAVAPRLQDEFI